MIRFLFLFFFSFNVFAVDYKVNFIDSDIVPISEFITQITQKPVVFSTTVTGTYTLFSSRLLPSSVIVENFKLMLKSHNFELLETSEKFIISNSKLSDNKTFTFKLSNFNNETLDKLLSPFVSSSSSDFFNYSFKFPYLYLTVSSSKVDDYKTLINALKNSSFSRTFILKSIYPDSFFDKFNLDYYYISNNILFAFGSKSQINEVETFISSVDSLNDSYKTNSYLLHSVKPSEMAKSLKDLFPSAVFIPFDSINKIVVKYSDFSEIDKIISSLDVQPIQLKVEIFIVQVGTEFKKEFGLSIFSNDIISSSDSAIKSNSLPVLSGSAFKISSNSISSIFRFLNSDSNSVVLSSPSFIISNGSSTKLVSGSEVPFSTGSFRNNFNSDPNTNQNFNGQYNSIQRKDVGLTLDVSAHYYNDDNIKIDLKSEISSLLPNSAVTLGASDLVTIKKQFDTTFSTSNGSYVVLAGLEDFDTSESSSKPFGFNFLSTDVKSDTHKQFLIFASVSRI